MDADLHVNFEINISYLLIFLNHNIIWQKLKNKRRFSEWNFISNLNFMNPIKFCIWKVTYQSYKCLVKITLERCPINQLIINLEYFLLKSIKGIRIKFRRFYEFCQWYIFNKMLLFLLLELHVASHKKLTLKYFKFSEIFLIEFNLHNSSESWSKKWNN
jgi:hypothetical protein